MLLFDNDPRTNEPVYRSDIKNTNVVAEIERIFETKENVYADYGEQERAGVRRGIEFAPYYCQKCKTVESNYFFRLVYTGGSYEPTYLCKKCKSDLLLAEYKSGPDGGIFTATSDMPVDLCCPECGHKMMVGPGGIDWD